MTPEEFWQAVNGPCIHWNEPTECPSVSECEQCITGLFAIEIQRAIEAEREACADEPLGEECEEGECIHNSERECHAFAIRARSSEPAKSGEKE